MNYQDNWAEICDHINCRRNVTEAEFQFVFETLFGSLGWYKRKGELIPQYPVKMGSTTKYVDIALQHEFSAEIDIFIELKRPCLPMSSDFAEQLKSYMKIKDVDFGILIGDTMQVFYKKDKLCDIPFDPKSKIGAEIISILAKDKFNATTLKDYSESKIAVLKEQEKVQHEINNFCSSHGKDFVIDLIKKELSKTYSQTTTDEIIDNLVISIMRKGNIDTTDHEPDETYGSGGSGKDMTKYRFNGTVYPKNRLVLAVVQEYVKQNKGTTISQLSLVFPKILQGTLGVFMRENEAKQIHHRTKYKRHFINSNEIIKLADGSVCVCTQWGTQTPNFVNHAITKLGFNIEEIKI